MAKHKVVAYYDSAKGLGSRALEVEEGDDVSLHLRDAMAGRVQIGGVSYLGHEPQEHALKARSAAPGIDKQAFIHQRVGWLHSTRGRFTTPVQKMKMHPLSDEAEAASRNTLKKAMEGEWLTEPLYAQQPEPSHFAWSKREDPASWTVDPTPTPFMDLARQAMAGCDFERKLEQLRKDQEELCGIKVGVDPAVGCDTFVISTGRRAGKTALIDAVLGMGPAVRAGKSIEEIMREACERAWGGTPKMPAQDPSAVRDEIAMARGSCKPVNRPHKDEKPANPYPPAHPKAAPAGLLAVSAMESRMGNRWAP